MQADLPICCQQASQLASQASQLYTLFCGFGRAPLDLSYATKCYEAGYQRRGALSIQLPWLHKATRRDTQLDAVSSLAGKLAETKYYSRRRAPLMQKYKMRSHSC